MIDLFPNLYNFCPVNYVVPDLKLASKELGGLPQQDLQEDLS